MSTSTAISLASSVVSTLQSDLSGVLPIIFPFVIAVALLFGGYKVVKSAYHRVF